MNRAVDLIVDLRSGGALDERSQLELTLLAAALDDAVGGVEARERDRLDLRPHDAARAYETALCRFFTRLAEVAIRSPEADARQWFARIARS